MSSLNAESVMVVSVHLDLTYHFLCRIIVLPFFHVLIINGRICRDLMITNRESDISKKQRERDRGEGLGIGDRE